MTSNDTLVAEFRQVNNDLKKLTKRRKKLHPQILQLAKTDYDFVDSGVSVNKSNNIDINATIARWEEMEIEIPKVFVPEKIIPEKIIPESWITDEAVIEVRSKTNGALITKETYTVTTS